MGVGAAVRVLVVDDQQPFRDAARAVVGHTSGFAVVGEATSGGEAVELCRSVRPDLVLMDVRMPGIDGREAARQIEHAQPATVVVLLSSYGSSEGVEAKASLSPDFLRAAWRVRASSGTLPLTTVPAPGADSTSS